MAQYFEPTTDTDANFANSVSGQANSFFLPSIYSKKVLNFFRKSSVVEAITNTDYAGEISAYGDSVKIIKEPVISVSDYTRGQDTTPTKLTDQELTLVVDSAKAFKFIVDDIERDMSHVNFKEVATSSAAYALRDSFDSSVIESMFSGVSSSAPDHVLGADSATKLAADVYDGAGSIDLGISSETDPLNVLARMARLLDDANVPEEPLFAGGPVNERALIMLHSRDWRSGNTMNVNESLGITSDDNMLFRYTQGDTARYYRFFAGASIWHPQQIKEEIRRNNWLIANIELDVIFDTDPRNLWDTAVELTASETMDRFL